jgi:hypothetical protein
MAATATKPAKMTRQEIDELTARTYQRAYYGSVYGLAEWHKIVKELVRLGYNTEQVEAIVYSKWPRWASVSGNPKATEFFTFFNRTLSADPNAVKELMQQ